MFCKQLQIPNATKVFLWRHWLRITGIAYSLVSTTESCLRMFVMFEYHKPTLTLCECEENKSDICVRGNVYYGLIFPRAKQC